jgi:hypothetical protein
MTCIVSAYCTSCSSRYVLHLNMPSPSEHDCAAVPLLCNLASVASNMAFGLLPEYRKWNGLLFCQAGNRCHFLRGTRQKVYCSECSRSLCTGQFMSEKVGCHNTLHILLEVRHRCSKAFHVCLLSTTMPSPFCMSGMLGQGVVLFGHHMLCAHISRSGAGIGATAAAARYCAF